MEKKVEVKKGLCRWCHGWCKVEVTLEDGKVVKQWEDPDHPKAELLRKMVRPCPRARAVKEHYYHPDRLRYPLKRAGEKGEGKWQQISWDQAFEEIAAKIKNIVDRYGPEAICTTAGTSRTTRQYAMRFINLLDNPNNTGTTQICYGPGNTTSTAMYGFSDEGPGFSRQTKVAMFVGTNPEQAFHHQWFATLNMLKAGCKLIVIDPRRTVPAEKANLWLQLRPGTDCALLMAMINVIISEGLYDKEFVQKWCYGFDKLVERAKEYPLDRVAEITWVPADKIRDAARMYATHRPGLIVHSMGLEQISNGIQAIQARYILTAICGNIDVRGGEEYRIGPHEGLISEKELELNGALSEEQKAKQIGAERFRLSARSSYELIAEHGLHRNPCSYESFAHAPLAYRAMLTGKPYPIRGAITFQNNPMVANANTKLVYKALKSLDLYVVHDHWMTPSADIADYVTPCTCWLERPEIHTYNDFVQHVDVGERILPATVDGQWDRKTDYEFFRGLGIRLGQEKHWPWETAEEAMSYRLSPMGYDVASFIKETGGRLTPKREEKKYERIGFGTPTGKVELYSTIFEKIGYDPLPRYEEPSDSPISKPELAKEYPLILITGSRHQPFFHSEERQVDSLRKMHPWPLCQLHPETAAKFGISDGDWVWIESHIGRCMQKCQIFDGIDPRVVNAQHGWWYPELPGEEPWLHGVWESNINVVLDDDPEKCNKIYGSWPLRATLCKVYKAKTY